MIVTYPRLEPRRRRLLLDVQLQLAREHDTVVDGLGRVQAEPALGTDAHAKGVKACRWIVTVRCTGSVASKHITAGGPSWNISVEP